MEFDNKNIPTRNVMKEDFGWDVPVESIPLPSKGRLYSKKSPLFLKETLDIKAMTASEEDILTSQAYIKEGVVIDKLIESCITDKNITAEDLLLGDRNALMVGIRITGYGSIYPITYKCMHCGSSVKHDVDLTELEIKRLKIEPVAEGANEFAYKLPVTGKVVSFKFLTGKDEKEKEISRKRLKALGIEKQGNVTDYLESCILSVDSITDKNKITHFIKNMPARDSKDLRKFIQDNEPSMNMMQKIECSSCGKDNDLAVPITSEFFWPST